MNSTRRILELIAPHRSRVALAFLLTTLACLLNLLPPLLVQHMVDRLVSGDARWPAPASALLGVYAVQALVSVLIVHVIGPVGLLVVRDLRHALYARLQRLGLSFYDRTPAGAIISRLMDDVAVVQSLITTQALAILTDLGTTVAVFGLLMAYDLAVGLAALLVLGVYGVAFRLFGRRIRSGSNEVRERLDRIFARLKERVDGMLVVRAHAREQAEVVEFAERIRLAHEPRVRVGWLGAALSSVSIALSGLGTTLVLGVAALGAISGRMTPGEAAATATLAGLLFGPVSRLADLLNTFEQAATSAGRLGEILDMQPEVLEPAAPRPIGRARGRVEFDRVEFAYKHGHPVLRDIRLGVEPGMKVALVGPTGCGKTTLTNLLLRFYDPTAGEIRLDGVRLDRLATDELRRQIAVVPQEPVVFARSLAENIRYGAADADLARVEAAARAALVHDFATALPRSYETHVGEGGYKLSQGERQRLAIARAFCKDAPLIILDEATSSLDTASEARIQIALANLLEGRTAFIIAHRLATVVEADLIVVLDHGRIVQAGRHADLLADDDGPYAQLAARAWIMPGPPRRWRPDVATGTMPGLTGPAHGSSHPAIAATQEAMSA